MTSRISNTLESLACQILILTEKLIIQRLEVLQITIDLEQVGKGQEAAEKVKSKEGFALMQQIRAKLVQMIQVENELLAQRREEALATQRLSTMIDWSSTMIAIIIGSIVCWIVSRVIMKPIGEATNGIASSATEIASTVEEQERIASEQASFVNQTTTTMQELSDILLLPVPCSLTHLCLIQ